MTVTTLKTNNNNENTLHMSNQHESHTCVTIRGGHWPPAGLGTTHTHRPHRPRPPEAVREPPTAPYGRYTHSGTEGASSACFGS